jgi:cobalamin-dependent methionine synthase I
MIIIGELINASRNAVAAAIEHKDVEAIQKLARDQAEAGADYIDVNAGLFEDREPEYLCWLVQTVQAATDRPCALDSPNPDAIAAALEVHQGIPMINSISLETERYRKMLPVLTGTGCRVIALCMSDEGMPETLDDRLCIVDRLVSGLRQQGVQEADIFVDPMVQPVSVNTDHGEDFFDALERIAKYFRGVHTVCGLSNISYGLPGRLFLNQTFVSMAIAKGLDSAILNPLDKRMMATILAAEALKGKDAFCLTYLDAYRSGQLDL